MKPKIFDRLHKGIFAGVFSVFGLIGSIILTVVVLFVYNFANSHWEVSPAVVQSKDYEPSYYTTEYRITGDGYSSPHRRTSYQQFHPERYILLVAADKVPHSVDVSAKVWGAYEKGDDCTYNELVGPLGVVTRKITPYVEPTGTELLPLEWTDGT